MKLTLLTGILLGALIAPAATLTNVTITNTSSPNVQDSGTGYSREFRTELTSGPVTTNSISAVLRWYAALQVLENGPDFANVMFVTPAVEISFTIDDPLNLGYSLSAETALRGYTNAIYAGGGSGGPQEVFASGVGLAAFFDNSLILPISLGGIQANANATTPNVSELVTDSGNANLGNFVGTRTFTLRMSNAPSPGGTFGLQNFVYGETAFLYGLSPDNTDGLSVNITATFAESESVPEPGTYALVGAGLLAVAVTRSRNAKKA